MKKLIDFNSAIKALIPYIVIFGCLIFYNVGSLLSGNPPFMQVIPCLEWGLVNDVAVINYSAYIAGHHLLNGMSFWSFNETFGNNIFSEFSINYFSPSSLLGAFLVDWFNWDVFYVFGAIVFLKIYLMMASFYYYLKHHHYFSSALSILGSTCFLALTESANYIRFDNYLSIVMFTPLLLICLDRFFKKISAQNSIFLSLTLSVPMFFGMENIYLNYLGLFFIASAYYLFRERKNIAFVRKNICILGLAFCFALLINLPTWGPVLIDTFKNSAQNYSTGAWDSEIINPFRLPFELLKGVFGTPGGAFNILTKKLFQIFPSILNQSIWAQEGRSLPFKEMGFLLFIFGLFVPFRRKRFEIHHFWLFVILGLGVFSYIVRLFEMNSFNNIFGIVKLLKYQYVIASPLLILFLLDGVTTIFRADHGKYFKSILVATLVFTIFNALSPVIRETVVPWWRGHEFPYDRFYFATVPREAFNCCTTGVLWINRFLITLSALIFLIQLYRKEKNSNMMRWATVGILFGTLTCHNWFRLASHLYLNPSHYFGIEKNEILVKDLLNKDSKQFRVLYIEQNPPLSETFPLEKNNTKDEQCDRWSVNHSRIFTKRANFLDIPIPDGVFVFASHEKANLYTSDNSFSIPRDPTGNTWNIINPWDKKASQIFNVKYLMSHYPLPNLTLIQKTDEYWAYLYELENPLPIVRLKEGSGSSSFLHSYEKGFDSFKIRYESSVPTEILIHMTLDSYWKAFIEKQSLTIEKYHGAFARVSVPKGLHVVIFIYDYWPMKIIFIISLISFVFLFWVMKKMNQSRA